MNKITTDSMAPMDVATFTEPIIPFDDITTPEIGAGFLPGWAGDFVREVSACGQVPESFVLMLEYATLGACLQQRYCVSPYGDSYSEPMGIWVLGILPPGARKTFVIEQLNEPLIQWEHSQAQSLKFAIEESKAARTVIEKQIEKLEKEAAKQNDYVERDRLIREMCNLRDGMPIEIVAPRIFTNDCTPERFQSLLVENGERMAVLSDEGGIFEVMSGLYSDGRANIDVFLKSHAGSPVRVDRGGREAHLDRPTSTFGLGVQPAIIEDLSRGSKRRFRGTGCLARFLYCIPKSNVGYRDVTLRRKISDQTRQRYFEGIRSLLNLQPNMSDGIEQPRTLILDPEALKSFTAFQQAIEQRQREPGDLAAIADWTAKLPGAALRLAGIAHIVEYGTESLVISRATMERALDLIELLIPHAMTAFSLMGSDPAMGDAQYVGSWIKRNGQSFVKQNDIYRGCHGRIDRTKRLQEALTILIDRHILSEPVIQQTGGRPSIYFQVNPEFLGDR